MSIRVYGRYYDANGNYTWQVIQTDANGFSDYAYVTALIQCFRLNLGESPFWANFGIPAKQAVEQQLPPDYYINLIQQFFLQFFPSLIVSRVPKANVANQAFTGPIFGPPNVVLPNPADLVYYVQIMRDNGSILQFNIGF